MLEIVLNPKILPPPRNRGP